MFHLAGGQEWNDPWVLGAGQGRAGVGADTEEGVIMWDCRTTETRSEGGGVTWGLLSAGAGATGTAVALTKALRWGLGRAVLP